MDIQRVELLTYTDCVYMSALVYDHGLALIYSNSQWIELNLVCSM